MATVTRPADLNQIKHRYVLAGQGDEPGPYRWMTQAQYDLAQAAAEKQSGGNYAWYKDDPDDFKGLSAKTTSLATTGVAPDKILVLWTGPAREQQVLAECEIPHTSLNQLRQVALALAYTAPWPSPTGSAHWYIIQDGVTTDWGDITAEDYQITD